MSSLDTETTTVSISVLNSTFDIDSEYLKVSDFFTTWLEGVSSEASTTNKVSVDVLPGITKAEVVIENIVKYMNITKGIRQDIVPYPLKEIVPGEKGMRSYVCKVRNTPAPLPSTDEENEEPVSDTSGKEPKEEVKEPYDFSLADFIDEYVETNGMLCLYEMIGYANYLGIKPLLYLCCAKIALMMKDKTMDEIKEMVDCQ